MRKVPCENKEKCVWNPLVFFLGDDGNCAGGSYGDDCHCCRTCWCILQLYLYHTDNDDFTNANACGCRLQYLLHNSVSPGRNEIANIVVIYCLDKLKNNKITRLFTFALKRCTLSEFHAIVYTRIQSSLSVAFIPPKLLWFSTSWPDIFSFK